MNLGLEEWSWLATVIVAGVATIAIVQARRLQKETSEPYVAVMLEANEHFRELAEPVVRNYGSTTARQVKVEFTPPAMRTKDGRPGEGKSLKVPSAIPALVPGQEWRTTWDIGRQHKSAKLDNEYKVKVSYKGLRRRKHKDDFSLDWSVFYDHTYLEVKTIHHVAKRLEGIKGELHSGMQIKGPVYTTRAKKPTWLDERRRKRAERRLLRETNRAFE